MRNTALRVIGIVLLMMQLPGPLAHAEDGISKDTILIGRTAGITGPAAVRAKPFTETIQAYFDSVNEAGGVNGRMLKLTNLDDANDPKRAADNVRKLASVDKVFSLIAASGTPPTAAVLPLLTEYQIPMLGTATGADSLRKPNKYMFHVKASFGDELMKIAEHIKAIGITRVAVVSNDDGTGREGSQLAAAALQSQGIAPLVLISFKSGEAKEAVAKLASANAQALVLVSVSGPGAEFFREFVKLPVRPQAFTWSVMVVEAIYKEVGEKAYGLVLSQTVPSPADRTLNLVRDYHELRKQAKLEDGGYSGLEAYIGARVLVEGLKRAGKLPTRAGLIAALESMRNFDLGGDMVGFTATDHVGRRFVELTIVGRDGRFLR